MIAQIRVFAASKLEPSSRLRTSMTFEVLVELGSLVFDSAFADDEPEVTHLWVKPSVRRLGIG